MEKKRAIALILTIIFVAFLSGCEEKEGAKATSIEEYPEEPVQKSIDNYSNKSMYAEVHPGDSIQQAIDNVSSGGTVAVYPGFYQENLAIDKPLVIISKYVGTYKKSLVVDKPLKVIRSEEKESTYAIIQAADPEKDIFDVNADNVTICGFNITGTKKAGIHLSGSNGNITENKLIYNEYGIYLTDSNRNVLTNNEINNNSLGIYLINSSNNWLKNNYVSDDRLNSDPNNVPRGIYLENSNNNKLISNSISKFWEGVNLTGSSNNELDNNSILHNYFSLCLLNSNNNKVLNNTIVRRGYSFSVTLANSQNNMLQGNYEDSNTEIEVFYSHDSTNNTLEYTVY